MEPFVFRQNLLVMDKSSQPILIFQWFCSSFIKKYFDMTDPPSHPPSKYHNLFSQKPLYVGNIKVLIFISSIWVDDHIGWLENNQWKWLWCNVRFQGISAIKALAHLIGTKCMHINRSRNSTNQDHLSRYKDLQKIKATKKCLFNDNLKNKLSSISCLQDKLSEVVHSNIHLNSRGVS